MLDIKYTIYFFLRFISAGKKNLKDKHCHLQLMEALSQLLYIPKGLDSVPDQGGPYSALF